MDDGEYGSFGWCFTSQDKSSWGSCSESCPLFGPAKVLAKKIDSLDKRIAEVAAAAATKSNITDKLVAEVVAAANKSRNATNITRTAEVAAAANKSQNATSTTPRPRKGKGAGPGAHKGRKHKRGP
jgi:hypothetical protein